MSVPDSHFTEPTTEYWQSILPSSSPIPKSPYQYAYPALLPDHKILMLPIRQTTTPNEAVASLLTTHAAIDVADQLGEYLAEIVRPFEPDVIVGLPTLGLCVARTVAKALGHKRYIPLGYSHKFWYTNPLLSTSITSITSPGQAKKIYIDPNSLPLLKNKKVFIIDDAISSGTTLKRAWELLCSESVGAEVLGAGVVMKQGERWREMLGEGKKEEVVWVFDSPLLKKVDGGWGLRA